MTEPTPDTSAVIDTQAVWSSYLAQEAARTALFETLRPANQAAIFDALTSAGVVTLVVNFDGYGDSGQIESLDARGPEGEIVMPDTSVIYASPSYGDDAAAVVHRTIKLAEAIETLCYDLLRQTHAGWENNDGAFGDFVFDVAARTISLDHNDRYTAIESYSHAW